LYVTQPTGFVALKLSARFRDTGPNQRVVLLLKEVNLQAGGETTVLTVDSDQFSSLPGYQTQTGPRACAFGLKFDQNAYYVEARLLNLEDTGVSPGLEAIWIERCASL
jgi:hypothetical protein